MKAPSPVDPYQQADAQAGANRDAAISSAIINNIDETSPFGSVKYTRDGTDSYVDSQGKTVTTPTYRRDVKLSAEQRALYDRQTQAGINLGDLAVSQSKKLKSALDKDFDPSKLPARASSNGIMMNAGTSGIKKGFGYKGPGVQTQSNAKIGPSGPIQRNVGPSDFSTDRRRVEDAIMSRYDRLHDREREAHEARLINQGLTPGSAAWNERMDELSRSRNDAAMQAILAGGQEQSRMAGLQVDQMTARNQAQQQLFGQNESRGLFALGKMAAENQAQNQNFSQYSVARDYERQGELLENQRRMQEMQGANQAQSQKFAQDTSLRNAAMQEGFAIRNDRINRISALMSGGQVTVPQFSAPYQQGVAAAPIGQYMQDEYESKLRNYNSMMSGMFGLGNSLIGGVFGLSDARTKSNVSAMERLWNGLGLYLFRYRHSGQWSVGVMAQEVARRVPDAVANIGGLLMVDYRKMTS